MICSGGMIGSTTCVLSLQRTKVPAHSADNLQATPPRKDISCRLQPTSLSARAFWHGRAASGDQRGQHARTRRSARRSGSRSRGPRGSRRTLAAGPAARCTAPGSGTAPPRAPPPPTPPAAPPPPLLLRARAHTRHCARPRAPQPPGARTEALRNARRVAPDE